MRAVQVVRAAGVLALCAGIATSCGKTHHSTLVLQVVGKADRQALDETGAVIRRRIDLLGIHDAKLRVGSRGRIVITTRRALTSPQRRVLTKQGSLAFYDLEADLATVSTNGYLPRASNQLDRLLARARAESNASGAGGFVLVDSRGRMVGGPAPRRALLARKRGAKVLSVPAHTTVVSCTGSTSCPGARGEGTFYYLFQYYPGRAGDPIPELTGRDLEPSSIEADVSSQGQGNVVLLGFRGEGNRKFREITETEAARGQALADGAGEGRSSVPSLVQRFAQHFAIVLDGELESSPYIDYKQNPNGIDPSETGVEISNIPSSSEAKDLAILLRSGALQLRLVAR